MRAFVPAAALTLLASTTATTAMDVGTNAPPALKYNDFALDGKTTYCYTVRESIAAAMFVSTELDLEGKGEECPLQLSLAQTTAPDVATVGANVEYKLTATVSVNSKNIFNGTALETPIKDTYSNDLVQISRANVHACSSSSTCDAFRKGNNSGESEGVPANFTDGKAEFTPTLNFSSADTYTVFAVVVLPVNDSLSETMRFVAYTTTTIGGKNGTSDDVDKSDPPAVPTPAPTSTSAAVPSTTLAGSVVVAGITAAASLLLMAF